MKWFHQAIWILNILLAVLTLLAYAVPYLDPGRFWPPAYLGLIIPYLILTHLLFVAYWLLFRRLRIWLSVVVFIGGWSYMTHYLQWTARPVKDTGASTIRVMSFNVNNFGMNNWRTRDSVRQVLFKMITDAEADIICFQEFFTREAGPYQNTTLLLDQLQWEDYYFYPVKWVNRPKDAIQYYGMAIFSRFPIIKAGALNLPHSGNNGCIYTDIRLAADTVVRIFNVHLRSLFFQQEDFERFEQKQVEYSHSKYVLRKLKYGYLERAEQSKQVAAAIQQSPYPVILAGDFNDTPKSFAYSTLKRSRQLQDAFQKAGRGFSYTYAGPLPLLRIDYILVDPTFRVFNYRVYDEGPSDHYPVTAVLGL